MTILITDFTLNDCAYNSKSKHIRNVVFINAISKVFISIVTVSLTLSFHLHVSPMEKEINYFLKNELS
jgi:hypothetical protein